MSCANHAKRVVFIKVPKTGGTSVVAATPWLDGLDHTPYKAFGSTSASYFSFAFSRNPYDRFLSAFCWRAQKYNAPSTRREIAEAYNADDLQGSLWAFMRHFDLRWFNRDFPFMPQEYFVTVDGALQMDFVGKFETIQDSMDSVCDRLDEPRVQLPCTNKTRHPPWRAVYTCDMLRWVNRAYDADFRLFGYPQWP